MVEYVTLVDGQNNVTGKKDRQLVEDADCWRSVTVWVSDPAGNILIARRKLNKRIQPGKWASGASGTVTYPDSYELTAVRELEEELGIKRDKLVMDDVYFYKSTLGSRFEGLFRTVVDPSKEDVKFQEEEVEEIKWVSRADLKRDIRDHPENYVTEIKGLLEFYDD